VVALDLDLATFITVLLGVTAIVATLLYYLHGHGYSHGKIERSIERIDKRLDKWEPIIMSAHTLWELTKSPEFLPMLMKVGKLQEHPTPNPYDPQRKRELLQRYSRNEVDLDDALELQRILQEDLRTAQGIAAVAVVILTLAGLGALIYALTRE